MGETLDPREAQNETRLDREKEDVEIYIPRVQVSALLRLERPMMYVCVGEPVRYKPLPKVEEEQKPVIPPVKV
jgi:hypothetical protein